MLAGCGVSEPVVVPPPDGRGRRDRTLPIGVAEPLDTAVRAAPGGDGTEPSAKDGKTGQGSSMGKPRADRAAGSVAGLARQSEVFVVGPLEHASARGVISEAASKIEGCVDGAHFGLVEFSFALPFDAGASSVRPTVTVSNAVGLSVEEEQCLVKRARKLQFPMPDGEDAVVRVGYTFSKK
jgi:hypothetical protein